MLQPISKDPYRLFLIPCDKQVFRLFLALPIQIKCVLREIQRSPLAGGHGDLRMDDVPQDKGTFLPETNSLGLFSLLSEVIWRSFLQSRASFR